MTLALQTENMTIMINNEVAELPDERMSLREMLEWHCARPEGTAVAVNGRLVPRSRWDATYMAENDDVVLISAAFGG